MDATQAHQTELTVNGNITSSYVWTYVIGRISASAAEGASYLIDPMAGLDRSVPLDHQVALYGALSASGYTITETNDLIASGAFAGAPTKRISW